MVKHSSKQVPFHEPGKHLSQEAKAWFYREVRDGKNPYKTGERLGVGRGTVSRLMKKAAGAYDGGAELSPNKVAKKMATYDGDTVASTVYSIPPPILRYEDLQSEYAQQAYKEFGYFRHRYYNRRHVVWQVEMVQILMKWWEAGRQHAGTEEAEIIKGIINTPPGGGKTTTVTHDFPSWVSARERNTRIALGSRTTGQSKKYVRRIRTTFEKNLLLQLDFGRFKPEDPETWRADEFIIDGVVGSEPSLEFVLSAAGFDHNDPRTIKRYKDPEDPIHEIIASLGQLFLTGEKESSYMALAQEMGFLGGRFDLNLWDDLCDRQNSRTPDQREALTDWWFAEAESRAEPGGIVALIGTRYGKYDLYRHARDLTYITDDEETAMMDDSMSSQMSTEQLQAIQEDIEKELVDKYDKPYSELATVVHGQMQASRQIYRYVKFPAHDERKCQNPGSNKNSDHLDCVLDPQRFSYRHIAKVEAADPRKFRLTYQQEDETGEDNLVQKIWLTGGTDGKTHQTYPGCYDYARKIGAIPDNLRKEDCFSIGTVDPSAVNFWSIQWWIYDAENDRDYLIRQLRVRIGAGTFLDWNKNDRMYKGILEDWQKESISLGWPIGLWIVEQAGAQRYLFQYSWVQEWMRDRRVMIKGHETHSNKADSELGIQTLSSRYQLGLVNLPFDQTDIASRVIINELTKELTEWPDSATEDMVMGHWFLHFNRYTLPRNLRVDQARNAPTHIYSDNMPDYVREHRGAPTPTGAMPHRLARQNR